jgi:hypothetical protein
LKEEENVFFVPCPARSIDFDSRSHQKLELYKVEVFKIHNVWNVRLLWKKSKRYGKDVAYILHLTNYGQKKVHE